MQIIDIGTTGPQVYALQKLLREAGFFDKVIDGVCGPDTKNAVIEFQKANGLFPDGVPGTQVFNALEAAIKKKTTWDEVALKKIRQGTEVWNHWREGRDINLEGAQLDRLELPGGDLRGANLKGAIIRASDLRGAHLQDAILVNANLTRSDLSDAALEGADFRSACLNSTLLCHSHLDSAQFSEADCFEINLRGAELNNANFSKAKMIGANLIEAEANRADFSGAFCLRAMMSDSVFTNAIFRRTSLCHARLESVNFTDCDMREVDFSRSSLIGSDFTGADISGSRVFGVSAWDINLTGTKQSGLIVNQPEQPRILVDDIEVAQLIHVLLDYKKLKSVFNTVTQRGVLLLGRFKDGGLSVLHSVAGRLRQFEQKYMPIIFDFERPTNRDLIETIVTLAGLSRFIIADLSGPMVAKELGAIIPVIKTPCIQITQSGQQQYQPDISLYQSPWIVQEPVEYQDVSHLLGILEEDVVKKAEELRAMRLSELQQMYLQ